MKRLFLILSLLGAARAAHAQIIPPATQLVNVQDSGVACSLAGACATWTLTNAPTATFTITGTFDGTLTFEATSTGNSWFVLSVTSLSSTTGAMASTTMATGQFSLSNTGITAVRVRAGTLNSGGANISLTRGTATALRSTGGSGGGGGNSATEPINVRDPPYNATGDGTTDDTAAIQAAFDYALGPTGTCQSIYVPSGNYKLTAQLSFYNRTTPGAKDCGLLYGDGLGTMFQWLGPYWQSAIRLIGSFQAFRDFGITAFADWIAGIDYSGSNANKVGTVSIGRASTATFDHIWVNCNSFRGDAVDIGRYGYQSDMLILQQNYLRNCVNGNGVKSFNSNTQSMKFIGGVMAHNRIAFGKNTTTDYGVFEAEIDANDINFNPSGGGTIIISGGRTENAKRFYYDGNGTSGGPRIYDGIQHANINLVRATTTVTTYTTLSTPSAPTVTPTGAGASTWGYKVACDDAQSDPNATTAPTGHTPSSSETTASNGATLSASVYNTITFTPSTGSSMCAIYRTSVGTSPSTTGTIAFVPYYEASSVVDNGLVGDGVTPPTTNTTTNTAVLSVAGFVEGDQIAIDGAGSVAAAGVLVTTPTDCFDTTHCHLGVDPTADVVAAEMVLQGDGCTAAMMSGSVSVVLTTPCVAGNATVKIAGAGTAGADLTTTLTAATCVFAGSPHTMTCDGSVMAATTVTTAAVKSPTFVYWQNAWISGQSGPYHLRGALFQPSSGHMQVSTSRANSLIAEGNYWADPAMADLFGRLAPTCTAISIGNLYGSPPTPQNNCLAPALAFAGTSTRATLSGNVVLAATDPTYQFYDANGSDRTATLPTAALNLAFVVKNFGGSNTVTVLDSLGSTVTVLAPGSTASVYYDGTAWQVF